MIMVITPTLFSGGTFKQWILLIYQNRGFAPRYAIRVFFDFLNLVTMLPFRIVERLFFHQKVLKTEIKEQPLFILGHWRSGTTHLHNLFCEDPQFGYIKTLQTSFPLQFLCSAKLVKALFSGFLAETRRMDNMKISFDMPQEDEMAIGSVTPLSFQYGFFFPKRMKFFCDRDILFNGVSP